MPEGKKSTVGARGSKYISSVLEFSWLDMKRRVMAK
jgi:hypothetical protein